VGGANASAVDTPGRIALSRFVGGTKAASSSWPARPVGRTSARDRAAVTGIFTALLRGRGDVCFRLEDRDDARFVKPTPLVILVFGP
jgi:hypothetical protein